MTETSQVLVLRGLRRSYGHVEAVASRTRVAVPGPWRGYPAPHGAVSSRDQHSRDHVPPASGPHVAALASASAANLFPSGATATHLALPPGSRVAPPGGTLREPGIR
jgi:hypothetical protein